MKVTVKQAFGLENLHRVSLVEGTRRATLDGKDWHYQAISLAANRVIAWSIAGRHLKINELEGINGARALWTREMSATQHAVTPTIGIAAH